MKEVLELNVKAKRESTLVPPPTEWDDKVGITQAEYEALLKFVGADITNKYYKVVW